MKVAVTFELDDDQRIAIGMGETGLLKPASMKEAREWIRQAGFKEINAITQVVTEARVKIAADIRAVKVMGDLDD